MSSRIREQLLSLLLKQGDAFTSGEEISRRLQCSRTAIWKQIEELRKEGYQVEARPKKGYRLVHRPDRVAPEELKPHLRSQRFGWSIQYHSQVLSTQLIAHDWARKGANEGSLVLTEEQTKGKGRMDRAWHSPPHSGIWMSLILRPTITLAQAPQLTLMAAVALTRALRRETGLDIRIKWPNDLLINGRKFCGILTETRGEQDQVQYVVLGMGINVNTLEDFLPDELRKVATSLAIEGGRTYHRVTLIASILQSLEEFYDAYLKQGFEPVRILWEEYAETIGREVRTETSQGTIAGMAVGLDPSGALLIRHQDHLQPVYSADID